MADLHTAPAFALIPPPAGAVSHEFVNYKQLVARAVDVFGDEIRASRWLSSASADFNGQTPLEFASRQHYDVQALEPVLIRIEHGIDF